MGGKKERTSPTFFSQNCGRSGPSPIQATFRDEEPGIFQHGPRFQLVLTFPLHRGEGDFSDTRGHRPCRGLFRHSFRARCSLAALLASLAEDFFRCSHSCCSPCPRSFSAAKARPHSRRCYQREPTTNGFERRSGQLRVGVGDARFVGTPRMVFTFGGEMERCRRSAVEGL